MNRCTCSDRAYRHRTLYQLDHDLEQSRAPWHDEGITSSLMVSVSGVVRSFSTRMQFALSSMQKSTILRNTPCKRSRSSVVPVSLVKSSSLNAPCCPAARLTSSTPTFGPRASLPPSSRSRATWIDLLNIVRKSRATPPLSAPGKSESSRLNNTGLFESAVSRFSQ